MKCLQIHTDLLFESFFKYDFADIGLVLKYTSRSNYNYTKYPVT